MFCLWVLLGCSCRGIKFIFHGQDRAAGGGGQSRQLGRGTAPSQVILRGEGMATGGSSGTARRRDVPVSRRTTDVLKVGLRLTESTICIACVCVLSTCTNDIGVKVKFQSFKTEMSELKIKGEA